MAGHQDGPRGVIGGTDPHGSELYGHRCENFNLWVDYANEYVEADILMMTLIPQL